MAMKFAIGLVRSSHHRPHRALVKRVNHGKAVLNLDALSQFDGTVDRQLEKLGWSLRVPAHCYK